MVNHKIRYDIDGDKIAFCYGKKVKVFNDNNVTCSRCKKAISKQEKDKRKYYLMNCDSKLAKEFGLWSHSEINEGNTVFFHFVMKIIHFTCGIDIYSSSVEKHNIRTEIYNNVVKYIVDNEDIEINHKNIVDVVMRCAIIGATSPPIMARKYNERIK